jgi:phospholipase/lecithinase/hemolysin
VYYRNILPDGIHPTAEGHKIVAETVWAVLKTQVYSMKTGAFFGILGIFFAFATPLHADELPTMSLSYLTQYAQSVVEVKPGRLIKSEDRSLARIRVLCKLVGAKNGVRSKGFGYFGILGF